MRKSVICIVLCQKLTLSNILTPSWGITATMSKQCDDRSFLLNSSFWCWRSTRRPAELETLHKGVSSKLPVLTVHWTSVKPSELKTRHSVLCLITTNMWQPKTPQQNRDNILYLTLWCITSTTDRSLKAYFKPG